MARIDTVRAGFVRPCLKMAPGVGGIAQPARLSYLMSRAIGDHVGVPVRRPAPFRKRAMLQGSGLWIQAVLLQVVPAVIVEFGYERIAARKVGGICIEPALVGGYLFL